MTNQHEIATRAARLFKQRDVLAARMRQLDNQIEAETKAYSATLRLFGFTTWMMRQACEARGLIEGRDAA